MTLFTRVALTLGCALALQPVYAEQLSLERIYSSPSLSGQTPKSLKFSPRRPSRNLLTREKRRLKPLRFVGVQFSG